MSRNLRDPKIEAPAQQEGPGLDPEELRAEQAGDLPDRDAMSIIGVGGLEGGLPPVDTLPVDPPILVDQPVDSLPVEPPADGDPIGVPDPPATAASASIEA
jgi:hypothetical protein